MSNKGCTCAHALTGRSHANLIRDLTSVCRISRFLYVQHRPKTPQKPLGVQNSLPSFQETTDTRPTTSSAQKLIIRPEPYSTLELYNIKYISQMNSNSHFPFSNLFSSPNLENRLVFFLSLIAAKMYGWFGRNVHPK